MRSAFSMRAREDCNLLTRHPEPEKSTSEETMSSTSAGFRPGSGKRSHDLVPSDTRRFAPGARAERLDSDDSVTFAVKQLIVKELMYLCRGLTSWHTGGPALDARDVPVEYVDVFLPGTTCLIVDHDICRDIGS